MIRKRIGIAASLIALVASTETVPKLRSNDEAKAGIVVSITEDFLLRGQNELISEFVRKLNRVGQEDVYELNLSDYLPDQQVP